MLGEKKTTRNTKLTASEGNKKKAEKLKEEIEKLIPVQKENGVSATDIISGEITLNQAIENFEKIFILGKSETHKQIFDYVMKRFKMIVPGKTNVKEIKTEHVTLLAASLKKSLAPATQYTYFQYLASLFYFLKDNNYIDKIPIAKGVRPKKAVKNIINFDEDDLDKILAEAKLRDVKYYQALMMFLLTGQRPGDVLRLQICDIDFKRRIIYFKVSKTKSEFKFPIYKRLESFLIDEMYLLDRNDREEYLFAGMTVQGIGQAFRKMKKKLGLNKYHYYTLKTFRKNFATDMSSMGLTIQEVQALLDHKSTSTTLRYYANVKSEELKTKIDRLQAED